VIRKRRIGPPSLPVLVAGVITSCHRLTGSSIMAKSERHGQQPTCSGNGTATRVLAVTTGTTVLTRNDVIFPGVNRGVVSLSILGKDRWKAAEECSAGVCTMGLPKRCVGAVVLFFAAGSMAQAFFPSRQQASSPAVLSPTNPVVSVGDPDPVKPPMAATPEPATVISGLIGLAALGGYRLRRRQSAATA
jgi:hypothetical protein